MRPIIRTKYKKQSIVGAGKVRTAIKKDAMLEKFLGSYSRSRIKGWGHTHGYIQVDEKYIDCKHVSRKEFKEANGQRHIFDVILKIYTTSVYLYAEYEHAKEGWTKEHETRLNEILKPFGLKAEDK